MFCATAVGFCTYSIVEVPAVITLPDIVITTVVITLLEYTAKRNLSAANLTQSKVRFIPHTVPLIAAEAFPEVICTEVHKVIVVPETVRDKARV